MSTTTETKTPSPQAALFKLTANQQALYELLSEVGGDVTGNEETVQAWMKELDGLEDETLDAAGRVVRRLELDASVSQAEAERYAKRAQVQTNGRDRFKALIMDLLKLKGVKRKDTQHFRFNVCGNGGKRPVEIDLAQLPDEYFTHVPKANMEAIYAALDEAEKANPGADLGAVIPGVKVKERGQHLRIS